MILILIGPPGCGKGTQADLLVERRGYKKLSTGDLLRGHIRDKSSVGQKAESYMAQGKLVPDAILLEIIGKEIEKLGDKVILDGFPRNLSQTMALEKLLGGFGNVFALSIMVDEDEIVRRVAGRRTCGKCSASYHVIFDRPRIECRCDKCGGELVQRPDDNAEKVKVRLDVYRKETQPVIDYLSKNCYLKSVEGAGEKEDIYKRLVDEMVTGHFD